MQKVLRPYRKQKKQLKDFLEGAIYQLHVSLRILQALEGQGIDTIQELLEKDPQEILDIENMGVVSLDVLRQEIKYQMSNCI